MREDKSDNQDEFIENNNTTSQEDEDESISTLPKDSKEVSFKLWLLNIFKFYDEHYILTTLIKFFFGFLILVVPLICMLIFNIIDFQEKNKYFLFPYFITICFTLGFLIILFIIVLCESCRTHGLGIFTWERKNLFDIFNTIFIFMCILWLLFFNESFLNSLEVIKERVSQSPNLDFSTKLFNNGSYTLRILFILFCWDVGNHEKLGYFEYEDNSIFKRFHNLFKLVLIPVIVYCCVILVKNVIFKNDKYYLYIILRILVLFQSFFFIYYFNNNADDSKTKDNNTPYFDNTGCKYVELIVYLLMIIILVILSFKYYIINLLHKKYYPSQNKETKIIIVVFCITSFIFCLLGYSLSTFLLFSLSFKEINSNLTIYFYYQNWIIICIVLLSLAIGHSFCFGNYIYYLIFYSVAYENSPHQLKNEYYVKCHPNNNFGINKLEFQGTVLELNDIVPSTNDE